MWYGVSEKLLICWGIAAQPLENGLKKKLTSELQFSGCEWLVHIRGKDQTKHTEGQQ